jgi:hypothetical protein
MSYDMEYCRYFLRHMRQEARKARIKIGKLTTYKVRSMGDWFEVYEDGELIWQGKAYYAMEAKINAIERKIERHRISAKSGGSLSEQGAGGGSPVPAKGGVA